MADHLVFFTSKKGVPMSQPYHVTANADIAYQDLVPGDYVLFQGIADITDAQRVVRVSDISNIVEVAERSTPISSSGNWSDLTALLSYLTKTLGEDFAVLKGGYMLASRSISQRGTVDVDLDLFSRSHYAKIKEALIAYGEYCKSSGAISSYRVVDEISDISGGAKYYLADKVVFSIDISDGADTHEYELAYVPGVGNMLCETLESVVADKASVLFSIRRFRRVKDLFDLFFLSRNATLNLDKVRSVLKATGRYPLNPEEYPFTPENLTKFKHAWDRFTIRETDVSGPIEKPDIDVLVSGAIPLLDALLDESIQHWGTL